MSHSGLKEELLGLLPLKGQTHGEGIANAVIECMDKHHIPLDKIVSISIDGAKSMTGSYAKIVEVEIGGIAIYRPFGEFHRANFTCSQVIRAAVAQWSGHVRHVMSSSPVPLKIHRVGQRCTLNLSRAEISSHWCGVVVRREVVPAAVSSTSLDHGSKP
ncbi:dimer_Tnp_hAT domain-containing protein [Trichonephila clavipes]|nr:dimer_Tnp_hAT domain-containing protein [Trichonephila clavipes]